MSTSAPTPGAPDPQPPADDARRPGARPGAAGEPTGVEPGPEPGLEPGIESPEVVEPQHARRNLLLRGTMWQGIGQFVPLIVNLALTPYIIGGLGKTVYAVFLLITVIQSFLAAVDGGIGPSANRYFSVYAGTDDRRATTRLLTTLVVLILAIAAVVLAVVFTSADRILAWFPATAVDPAGSAFLLHTMIVLVALSQVRNLFAFVLFSRHQFGLSTATTLLGYVVYVVGLVWTVETGRGLTGIAWTFMVQQAVATVLIIPSACRYLTASGVGLVPRDLLREFFSYSWKQQLSSLLHVAAQYGDMVIVQRFRWEQAGLFGPGSTFAQQLRQVPMNAYGPIMASVGSAVGAQGARGGVATFERLQKPWVVACVGWVAVGAPASYFGVNAWLHEALGASALPGSVAAVLLVGHLFSLITAGQIVWCLAVGRSDFELRYGLLGLALNLAGTLALIVPFGVLGSVVATAVAQLLATAYLDRSMRTRLEVAPSSPFRHVPVLPAVVAAALSFAGTWAASRLVGPVVPYGGLGLVVTGLGAAPALVVYALWVFGPGAVRDQLARRIPGLAR